MDLTNPVVWVHEEALGPANPALQDHPKAPALFVFDQAWIEATEHQPQTPWLSL